MHTCPMVTVLVPHVGGPILPPGAPTVLIGFLPAARVTDMLVCVGPPDVIVKGSAGVFINYLPAARMGDMTAHGGVIILGCPTVMIGEIGSPSPGAGGAGAVVAGMVAAGVHTPATAVPSKLGKGAARGTSPCAGKGMATPAKQQEFAKDMKTLQKDWKTLSVAQRKQRLADITNKQLTKSGAPKIGIADDPEPTNSGSMDFRTWNIDLNPSYLSKPDLSDGETQDLGDTMYHESRHIEQWYLIARKEAAGGKSAAQIHTDTNGMEAGACTAAKANPLPAHDPMSACASAMYNSVYGSGSAHRTKVLTDIYTVQPASDAAKAELKRVNDDPHSTPAQKKRARDKATAAADAVETNNREYIALPEEADAWQTGSTVGDLLAPKP